MARDSFGRPLPFAISVVRTGHVASMHAINWQRISQAKKLTALRTALTPIGEGP